MSKRLRTVVVGVLAAMVVSMTFAASAVAYKTGNYAGKTKQDYNFKFKAKTLGVKKFKLKIVTDCDDGDPCTIADHCSGVDFGCVSETPAPAGTECGNGGTCDGAGNCEE